MQNQPAITWDADASDYYTLVMNGKQYYFYAFRHLCRRRHYVFGLSVHPSARSFIDSSGHNIVTTICHKRPHSAAMCSSSVAGVPLGPGASAYQRIVSNNSYAHAEQGDNPGQEKEGLMVSCINCDRCRQLDLAVSSLPAAPAWFEANRLGLGWPLAGVIHSASQG